MLSMWFAELITNEKLGNGSSMIIFINIIGGLPANFSNVSQSAEGSSMASNVLLLAFAYLVYLVIVSIIVLVQDSYKKINIVSAHS